MAKLASRKCPNCGAPITLSAGVSDVPCGYCGNVIHVEWGKKPPTQAQKPPLTVYVRPGLGFLPVVILLGALLPVGIPLFLAFAPALKSVASEVAAEAGLAASTFPMHCGLNQKLSIVGQTFEGEGTLVTAEINCKIKIKNSKLKGDLVVDAKNLVEVTLENSTLEGKEAAVRLGMNSKLFATKKSVLKGEDAGIALGVNSEVSLDDSSVEGAEHGIRADTNFKLTGTRSKIVGKEYGIRASHNLGIEGRELVVQGSRAALEAAVNAKLDLRGGAFEGTESAIRVKGPNVELNLTRKARLTARETAVKVESNLKLEMEDALIDGGEVGVEASSNPKLSLGPGARIHGGQIALKVGINLELDMRSATLESEGVALCAPFNIEIQARESVIRAGADAFRFQRRPRELALQATAVTGSQLFNVQSCAPSRKR